jgi:drug/metabolite transporter (DMT)-like permease
MVRGGVVVINAIGSVLFLRRVLFNSHKLGCAFVVFGILVVGLQSMLIGSGNSEYSVGAQTIALILILISLFTDSIRYLYEELLFR